MILNMLIKGSSLRQDPITKHHRAIALMNQFQNNRMSKVKTMMMIVCTMASTIQLEVISRYSITRKRISQLILGKWATTQSTRDSTSSDGLAKTEKLPRRSYAAIATRETFWEGPPFRKMASIKMSYIS
jgi:hypothetical protein